jgi:hypothetical protein
MLIWPDQSPPFIYILARTYLYYSLRIYLYCRRPQCCSATPFIYILARTYLYCRRPQCCSATPPLSARLRPCAPNLASASRRRQSRSVTPAPAPPNLADVLDHLKPHTIALLHLLYSRCPPLAPAPSPNHSRTSRGNPSPGTSSSAGTRFRPAAARSFPQCRRPAGPARQRPRHPRRPGGIPLRCPAWAAP